MTIELSKTQLEYWPNSYRELRKEIIADVKLSTKHRWLLRIDGKVERYFGTEANVRGWSVITYDPHYARKRPGIPQYKTI